MKLALWPDVFALPPDARHRELRRARNTVQEMIVHLRAVKPARPRDVDLLQWPVPELTDTVLDFDAGFAERAR